MSPPIKVANDLRAARAQRTPAQSAGFGVNTPQFRVRRVGPPQRRIRCHNAGNLARSNQLQNFVQRLERKVGRDFDQDTHQHPDERFIVDQTLGLSWPTTSAQFFDVANSPLNLRRAGKHYPYGSLPVYLTKGVAWAVDAYLPPDSLHGKGWWLGYEGITKIGRMLAAFFDLINVQGRAGL